MSLPLIEPRWFFIAHHRMGSTVHFGPFATVDEARSFAERYKVSPNVIGMIDPADAIDPTEGVVALKSEVWH